jgi:DNA-binding MurR/RpiR family transcriptional regulator
MDPILQKRFYNLQPRLSGQLRKLADFILKDGNDVCFLNARDLAQTAGVSPSSVVRFSRKLGYEGFQSLKAELQDGVRRQLSSSGRVEKSIRSASDSPRLSHIMRQEADLLGRSLELNSEEDFQGAAKALCRADSIYFVGQRSSFAIAYFVYYRLCRLGLSCKLVTVGGPAVLFSELASLRKTDLLLVVGFQKISREVQSAVRSAKERRATVLLLTSTAANPVAGKADIVIFADRGSAELLQSVTAGFSLGHALVIAVASQLGTRSLAFLNAIDVMEEESLRPKPEADN